MYNAKSIEITQDSQQLAIIQINLLSSLNSIINMGVCQAKQPKSTKNSKNIIMTPEISFETPLTPTQHPSTPLKASQKIISILKKNVSSLSTIKEVTPELEKSPNILQIIKPKLFN